MRADEARRGVAAATATARDLGLAADDAVVVNDSTRLVVRLLPCDVVARVTSATHGLRVHLASAERELTVVHRLAKTGCPVAPLDARVEPRAYVRDDFDITLWTYCEPAQAQLVTPIGYARELERLHAGLRQIDIAAPHVMERVSGVQQDLLDTDLTPDLAAMDRALLAETVRELKETIARRRAPEQLLHGEPHSWNVLETKNGPLLIDFENTARGPVEYDLGWVPRDVSDAYAGADQALVDHCRGLAIAMITAYRWRRDDEHPSGRDGGVAYLDAVRAGPPWPTCNEIVW